MVCGEVPAVGPLPGDGRAWFLLGPWAKETSGEQGWSWSQSGPWLAGPLQGH